MALVFPYRTGRDVLPAVDDDANPGKPRVPVYLADVDGTQLTLPVSGAGGGGTEYDEDAVPGGTITGGYALGKRRDADTSPVGTDGDFHGLIFDDAGNLKVNVKVTAGAGGGTEYDEGDVAATITGTAIMWEDAADTLRPVSAAKPLPVELVTPATVPISAATLPLPTGAATATLQGGGLPAALGAQSSAGSLSVVLASDHANVTVDGTVAVSNAFALDATLGDAVTALQVIDDWDEADRAKVNPIVGSAGITGGAGAVDAATTRVAIATDANAVSVASLPLPTDASTLTEQQTQTGHLSEIEGAVETMEGWDESSRAAVNLIAGQTAITAGAGPVATNTPRVTLASDDPVVDLLVTIDSDTSTLASFDFATDTALTTMSGKLPAALVGGRLDTNVGGWFGSTAPSIGQKAAASSVPVVLSSAEFPAGSALADGGSAATSMTRIGARVIAYNGSSWDSVRQFIEDGTNATARGPAPLMTRTDTLATVTPVAGDWIRMRGTSKGALWTRDAVLNDALYSEDVATPSTITGFAPMAERTDALATVTPADGDWVGLRTDERGALWTAIPEESAQYAFGTLNHTAISASPTYTTVLSNTEAGAIVHLFNSTEQNMAINFSASGTTERLRLSPGEGITLDYKANRHKMDTNIRVARVSGTTTSGNVRATIIY